jgi:hypothetical protein
MRSERLRVTMEALAVKTKRIRSARKPKLWHMRTLYTRILFGQPVQSKTHKSCLLFEVAVKSHLEIFF